MTAPRIVLVDDHDEFRRSTTWWLRGEGYEVSSYGDGESAVEALLALPRDGLPLCLLLDVRMPGISGPELHARLLQAGLCGGSGTLPVIYLTGHGDVPLAVEAMQKGAVTFLEKPVSNAALQAALARVRQPSVAPGTSSSAPGAVADPEQAAFERRLATLTEREQQVLDGLMDGLINKEIARRLGISHKTVELYRGRLMHKLALRNYAELMCRMLPLRQASRGLAPAA